MKKRQTSLPAEVLNELRQIYTELEQRALPRQCQLSGGCCQFRQTGLAPSVTRVEALYAALGVRAAGRKRLSERPDGACSCLKEDGRCGIYAHRPLGCRTHFCAAAGGVYPRKHVADIIQRLERLDEEIQWRHGPRDFPAALTDALEALE
jgi:uncharacterized protein